MFPMKGWAEPIEKTERNARKLITSTEDNMKKRIALFLASALLFAGCNATLPQGESASYEAVRAGETGNSVDELTLQKYMDISTGIDLCLLIDGERGQFLFSDVSELSSQTMFDFAKFILSHERYGEEKWEEWGENGIPAQVIVDLLNMRLLDPAFKPEEVDSYRAESDSFDVMIGGYGGVRFPRYRAHSLSNGVLSITIDYMDGEEADANVAYSRVYRYRLENDGYKLLAIEEVATLNAAGEEMTEVLAKELFEGAVKEIIMLASEDPALLVRGILDDDTAVIYEEITIDGEGYYKTTAPFEELRDYYGRLFTADALDWILSTKFVDVDGTLYCSPAGGASGWGITDVEIVTAGQNNGNYIYEATFNDSRIDGKTPRTSQFIIENTEKGYRISSIDYIPDLLKR